MSSFTRRDFMKLGIAAAGYLSLASPLDRVLNAGEENDLPKGVSPVTGKMYKAIPTTCRMCEAGCGILAFMEGKQVVALQGNPLHPNNKGKICAKGVAGINLLYDPERITFPMKRVGKRGEGKWKRITWDEAYKEIAGRMRERRRSVKNKEFVLELGPGKIDELSRTFSQLLGISLLVDNTLWENANRSTAHELTWGEKEGVYDISGSHYILNFGANPLENDPYYINLAQRIIEARLNNRAKLVTFDVRLSNTGGRSDEWVPLSPGTDGLVALALAHVIMEKGLADHEFLDNWTNYSSEELASYLRSYDPKMAEGISGVKASDLERIALEFVTNKPSTIISGGGITSHYNGVYNERCIFLLNAVAGRIDTRGGYCFARKYEFDALTPSYQMGKEGIEIFPELVSLLKAGKKVHGYMSFGANPIYSHPDRENDIKKIFYNESLLPFFVAVDTHMSETTMMADVVLPAATYLESWGLESRPSFELVPYLSITQPVSKPLGEAFPFSEICIQLAKRVGEGREQGLPFKSTEEYIIKLVSKVNGLAEAGGIDYLKARGVWFDAKEKPGYQSFKQRGFKTPSGKFEIYSKRLKDRGYHPLPVYQPLLEHANLTEMEFILIRYQVNVHTPYTANSKWLNEIAHDNSLWINPESARILKIKDGDTVVVSSKAGSLKSKVRLSQGIHPKVVALAADFGHWGYGFIARAKKFESSDPDTTLLWWGSEGNGINVNALIPFVLDPIGGGQAGMDTRVKLTKI